MNRHASLIALPLLLAAAPTTRPTGPATIRIDAAWILLRPAELAAPAPPAVNDGNVFCQSCTVGFDNQEQAMTGERTTSVITSLTPIVAPGVTAYQPTVSEAKSTVQLTVTPHLREDRSAVLVDVASTVVATVPRTSDLGLPTSRPSDDLAIRTVADQPDTQSQRFATSVRLRPGVPMVVGGMTNQPSVGGDHRALCLVLTARLLDDAGGR